MDLSKSYKGASEVKDPTEELCRLRFDDFLKRIDNSVSILWSDGDEPPDYYLLLDSEKFAVEVTSLIELIAVGSVRLPTSAITDALWDVVKEAEAVAKARGWLNGAYIVGFSQPIENFRSVREQVKQGLLTYIQTTQVFEDAPEQLILDRGHQSVRVKKVHNEADVIHKVGPHQTKWEGEVAEQICGLLEERVHIKTHKLRNISLPKILLLYDGYRFADARMYRNCIPSITGLANFHSIFVVQGEHDLMLHSTAVNWLI